MKKENQTFLIVAILIIIGILYFSGTLGKLGLFSSGATELGWIPFTEQSSSFTNLVRSDLYGACGAYTGDVITSKFWNINVEDTKACCNCYYQDTSSYSGGDGNLIISTTSLSGYPTGHVSAIFNENLYKKHFKINYQLDGCSYGCDFRSFGEVVSGGPASGTIELTPSVINDCSKLIINGNEIKEICGSSVYIDFTIAAAGRNGYDNPMTVKLSNPRYKPLFDCALDNDEVLIFDEFANSTTFNINDLSYKVRKFCINQPAIIRSFTDRGIAVDSDGEILLKLSEGGSVTVKSDQTIRVPYITQEQTGLLRCGLNEAYSTKEKKCINILSEGLPDEQPSVEVFTQNLGSNEVLFVQNYQNTNSYVGNLKISSLQPNYTCGCTHGAYVNPSEVDNSCWKTKINSIEFNDEQYKSINSYVSVKYYLTGTGVYCGSNQVPSYNGAYKNPSDWTNNLVVTINKNGLIVSQKDTPGIYSQNTQKSFSFYINNQISSFTDSGFLIKTNKKIIGEISQKEISNPISSGNNTYSINLDTDKLGDVETTITPYIIVGDKKIYSDSKLVVNYKVEQPSAIMGDLNSNGIIDRNELGVSVTNWLLGSLDRGSLSGIIQRWASQ